jgi:hypothetical protein
LSEEKSERVEDSKVIESRDVYSTVTVDIAEGNVSSKVLPSANDCERTGKVELSWMFAIDYPVGIETRIHDGPVELSVCE